MNDIIDAEIPVPDVAIFQQPLKALCDHVWAWATEEYKRQMLRAGHCAASVVVDGRTLMMPLTSGSYRLGVYSKDADIDVVFVTTSIITRDMIFVSLVPYLHHCAGVTRIEAVRSARVPIVSLVVNGQEFDVLTCHLLPVVCGQRMETLTRNVCETMIATYEWCNGVDETSIWSMGGPRFANAICAIMPSSRAFTTFLYCVRFMRHWAKTRLVYSNKCGYFGSVNLCILVAWIQQHFPGIAEDTLGVITHLFNVFHVWFQHGHWEHKDRKDGTASAKESVVRVMGKRAMVGMRPIDLIATSTEHEACPVYLKPYDWKCVNETLLSDGDGMSGSRSGNADGSRCKRLKLSYNKEACVVLTPCYPQTNSMYSATPHSVRVLSSELARAAQICNEYVCVRDLCSTDCCAQTVAPAATPVEALSPPPPALMPAGPPHTLFRTLCESVSFAHVQRWICVSAEAPSTCEGNLWLGSVQSQIRHLVSLIGNADSDIDMGTFRHVPQWFDCDVLHHCIHNQQCHATHSQARDDAESPKHSKPKTPTIRRHTYIAANHDGKVRLYQQQWSLDACARAFQTSFTSPPQSLYSVSAAFVKSTCVPLALAPDATAPSLPLPARTHVSDGADNDTECGDATKSASSSTSTSDSSTPTHAPSAESAWGVSKAVPNVQKPSKPRLKLIHVSECPPVFKSLRLERIVAASKHRCGTRHDKSAAQTTSKVVQARRVLGCWVEPFDVYIGHNLCFGDGMRLNAHPYLSLQQWAQLISQEQQYAFLRKHFHRDADFRRLLQMHPTLGCTCGTPLQCHGHDITRAVGQVLIEFQRSTTATGTTLQSTETASIPRSSLAPRSSNRASQKVCPTLQVSLGH
jgi:hypothetical protein